MIRINLLGVAKQRQARTPGAFGAHGRRWFAGWSGGCRAMIAVGLFNGGYWFMLDKQKREIYHQMSCSRAQEPRTLRRQARLHGASARSENYKAA